MEILSCDYTYWYNRPFILYSMLFYPTQNRKEHINEGPTTLYKQKQTVLSS